CLRGRLAPDLDLGDVEIGRVDDLNAHVPSRSMDRDRGRGAGAADDEVPEAIGAADRDAWLGGAEIVVGDEHRDVLEAVQAAAISARPELDRADPLRGAEIDLPPGIG